MDGRTHWEGCWREHLECAVARVEQLREAATLLKSRIDKLEHRTHRNLPEFCAHCAADELVRAALQGEGGEE